MTVEDLTREYQAAVEAVMRGPRFGERLAALEEASGRAPDEAAFRRVGSEIRSLLDEVFAVVDAEWVAAGRPAPVHGGA